MKRILLLTVFSFVIISCKDCPKCPEVQSPEMRANATATCEEVFVVNYSETLPPDWADNVICTRLFDDLYISIDELADSDKVKWLRNYADHINYDLSYRYIEKAHILKYDADAEGHNHSYQPLTLQTIKDLLVEEGSSFESDNYRHYLKIELDTSGNYSVEMTTSYRSGDKVACYSIPFFRSVVAQLKGEIAANPTFEYSIVNYESKDRLFLRVMKTNGKHVYYDYSDEPGHGVDNSPI